MKQILELVPILLFFLVYQMDGKEISLADWHYQFDGIFSATAVLIIATALQVILTRMITGHLERRLLLLFAAVTIFGGATLIFRNQLFIQWKPTIFNWVLAAIFLGSQWFSGKTIIERTLSSQINLPPFVWTRLNLLWVANFIIVGALNLFVAYNYSEPTWVSYKLYSSFGFTLVLVALTVMLIAPHHKEELASSGSSDE